MEKDGVTTRPGSDSPIDNGVLFIDDTGASAVGSPPVVTNTAESHKEPGKTSMLPRAGTPGRPKSRRGEDDDLDSDDAAPPSCGRPYTPVPGTPRPGSAGKVPGTPRGRRAPSTKQQMRPESTDAQDEVMVGSPGRKGSTSSSSSSDTSSDS